MKIKSYFLLLLLISNLSCKKKDSIEQTKFTGRNIELINIATTSFAIQVDDDQNNFLNVNEIEAFFTINDEIIINNVNYNVINKHNNIIGSGNLFTVYTDTSTASLQNIKYIIYNKTKDKYL